ncbi:MAG: hypothetical protein WCY62_10885 [Clostridia bacterium]|jgi:hypothetical protein
MKLKKTVNNKTRFGQLKAEYGKLQGYQKFMVFMQMLGLIFMILLGPFIIIAKSAKLKIR